MVHGTETSEVSLPVDEPSCRDMEACESFNRDHSVFGPDARRSSLEEPFLNAGGHVLELYEVICGTFVGELLTHLLGWVVGDSRVPSHKVGTGDKARCKDSTRVCLRVSGLLDQVTDRCRKVPFVVSLSLTGDRIPGREEWVDAGLDEEVCAGVFGLVKAWLVRLCDADPHDGEAHRLVLHRDAHGSAVGIAKLAHLLLKRSSRDTLGELLIIHQSRGRQVVGDRLGAVRAHR